MLCWCWPCYAVVRKVQFLTTHRVGWSMLTSKFSLCTSFDGTSRADATQLFQSLIDIFQEVVQYNKVSHASRHKYYDIFKFHLFIYFWPLEHVHCTVLEVPFLRSWELTAFLITASTSTLKWSPIQVLTVGLTSVILWELVIPTWYSRNRRPLLSSYEKIRFRNSRKS